jgi:hypothetical protein
VDLIFHIYTHEGTNLEWLNPFNIYLSSKHTATDRSGSINDETQQYFDIRVPYIQRLIPSITEHQSNPSKAEDHNCGTLLYYNRAYELRGFFLSSSCPRVLSFAVTLCSLSANFSCACWSCKYVRRAYCVSICLLARL